MEPSWNSVNGQNTKKLQGMVFYNQTYFISVKNRIVKVSTFHHPRYVCLSAFFPALAEVPHWYCFICWDWHLLCFISQVKNGNVAALLMCIERLWNLGTWFSLEMSKKFHTRPGCLQYVVTLIHKSEMLMFAKYGNCVQNVMDLLVNVFSNSRSNKCSWWIKTTWLLFLVFQKGDEVCWKNTLVTNSVQWRLEIFTTKA